MELSVEDVSKPSVPIAADCPLWSAPALPLSADAPDAMLPDAIPPPELPAGILPLALSEGIPLPDSGSFDESLPVPSGSVSFGVFALSDSFFSYMVMSPV